MTTNTTQRIAKTILRQLTAKPMVWGSWGSRSLVALNAEKVDAGYQLGGLQFKVSGRKLKGKVRVRLMADDTYTIDFIKNQRKCLNPGMAGKKFFTTECKLVESFEGAYSDMLHSVIDNRVETTR